jgi:ferredoxin
MKMVQIDKKILPELIERWSQLAQVVAPVKKENFTAFEVIEDASEIELDRAQNTRYPLKSLFLPQSEVLFRYKNGEYVPAEAQDTARVIFGARPCDARALTLLDTIFEEEGSQDPYWKTRRAAATLVGMGCDQPCESCFCTTVGSGPFDRGGLDVLITPLDGKYALEAVTEKGKALLETLPEVSAQDQKQVTEIQSRAASQMKPAFDPTGIRDKLYAIFEGEYWQQVQQSCLGCGVCTFLCPTCFCFDIVDETQRSERVRNWDTCMFSVYSLEASGHNPRPSRMERTRQRLMHKYAYWLDHIDQIGCTGCGRCVRYCPVGLDIRNMISRAQAWEEV